MCEGGFRHEQLLAGHEEARLSPRREVNRPIIAGELAAWEGILRIVLLGIGSKKSSCQSKLSSEAKVFWRISREMGSEYDW